MGGTLRVLRPEARELEKKKEAMSALQAELAEKELELLTLQSDQEGEEQHQDQLGRLGGHQREQAVLQS